MREVMMRRADVSPADAYAFSYPHLPERYEGISEKFPGLPLLIVDPVRRVVCGHDLLLLLRQRGEAQAAAIQVELALADGLFLNYNVLNRLFGLNLYEKLLFVKKISPWCATEEIQGRAELDFPLNDLLRQRLDMLLAEPFRLCLASGRLGLKPALKLADMGEDDRLALIGIFRACRFSTSQQTQVVQLLEETAFREKRPVREILSSGGLCGLLEREMPQKIFLEALQGLRYPALRKMEIAWNGWKTKAAAPGGPSLSHAPLFASDEIQITLTAKNRAEAEKLLGLLKKNRSSD
jgi:hypothetical protein